ncbi:MAG: hypothetical protein PF689_14540 [Deltaproteobacteria bacterium]|nr:hypothetical protein [Deltaproteobacteria bacterium]
MKNYPVLMPVGSKTPYWLTMLMEAGAVSFNSDGTINLDSSLVNNLKKIHHDLADGDPQLEQKLNDVFFNEVVPEINNMFSGSDVIAYP